MSRQSSTPHNGANLGFESECWKMADKLRNNMDAAEYKHVVLGLIFLKYISDAFAERHKQLEYELGDSSSKWYVPEPDMRYMALEDPDNRAERCLLGSQRGPVVFPFSERKTAHHRETHRRCHDRN